MGRLGDFGHDQTLQKIILKVDYSITNQNPEYRFDSVLSEGHGVMVAQGSKKFNLIFYLTLYNYYVILLLL